MKQVLLLCAAAVILTTVGLPDAMAGKRQGLQVSLVPSVQVFSESSEVSGVRINIIGSNLSMRGADLGLVNLTDQVFIGAGFGIANSVKTDALGLQVGGYNYAGTMRGVQCGAYNKALTLNGVQIGLVNHSVENNLLQAGLVNVANNREGWQIGVMNFNTDVNATLPGMIFVNGSF